MIIKLKPIAFKTDNYYPLSYELIIELFLYIVNNDFPLIFIIFNVKTITLSICEITKRDHERIVTYSFIVPILFS